MTVTEMIHKMSRSQKRRRHHRGGFRVMRAIRDEGSIDFSDLAQKLDIRPSSLSEALDRLEKRDMIVKTQHPDDKRKVVITLSNKAKQKFESHKERKDEQAELIEQALTKEEQAEFIRLSQKIVEALEKQSQ